ncbi:hypothetical protein, partial [Luteimonas abyssi]|uniref:hypothetical protein n=1 Tax=Luteimonas abyssi TaxID=1247514 RepID=UPI00192E34DF
GVISKKLLAIHSMLRYSVIESQKELASANSIGQELLDKSRVDENTRSYLAELRKAQKINGKPLTINMLSEQSGISKKTIWEWEKKGIPDDTSADCLYQYRSALNVSMDVIFHFSQLQKEKGEAYEADKEN